MIKNTLVRDKLAVEKNVLYFEMEAAGLINNFPYLVICGIYDYLDLYKNKEWQKYVVIMVAAYIKDFLYRIVLNKIEAEKKIGEVLFG